ncbi:MAG: glycosyltransferase family 2 protein [Gammaproteobacteria bacterium]
MIEPSDSGRPKLTVCVICRNAQRTIAACLSSVSWADEIVVLDSGSSDNTLKIAAEFTDQIHTRDDWQGFGVQRQRAAALASHDWIFALDSDEVVSAPLAREIQERLTNADDKQVFVLNRLTSFCGQFVRHSGWYPDPVARIYNRLRFQYNARVVHESLDCTDANLERLASDLLHYTFSDLNAYLMKRNEYAFEWAKDRFEKGQRASTLKALGSSGFAFFRHFVLRRGFLDGRTGLLISVIQMQYSFNKYMHLVCMATTQKTEQPVVRTSGEGSG